MSLEEKYLYNDKEGDIYSLNELDWDDTDPYLREVKNLYTIYMKKNHDYGNSFESLCNEFGIKAAVIRLVDKINRLKSLIKDKAQVNESTEDTVADLANYAIMTLVWLKQQIKEDDIPSNEKS